MNILMIAPFPIFPINVGDRVRIWQIANGIARYIPVTLVVPYEIGSTETAVLPGNCGTLRLTLERVGIPPINHLRRVRSLLSACPYHVALHYRAQIQQAVNQLLATEHFTHIYCHFIYSLPYTYQHNYPVILDQHNVFTLYFHRQLMMHKGNKWRTWILQRNLNKVIQFENNLPSNLVGVVSVSEAERVITQAYANRSIPVWSVPNGADTEQYSYQERDPLDRFVLGFLGSMELELNERGALVLLKEIYPAVQAHLPDRKVEAMIIGRNPSPRLIAWPQEHREQHVTVTGTVPDTLPYLHQLDALVLPLQSGGGTKLRVLEAMAAGVCIVGNRFAFMGLDEAVPDTHICVAEDATAFVEVLCDLAENPTRRNRIAQDARQLVEQHYSWNQITTDLAHTLQDLG